MKKCVVFIVFLLVSIANIFSKDIVLVINNVTVQNGRIYIAIYSNENDYKNENHFMSFIKEPINQTITLTVDLPDGEYVVSVFQDNNSNGKLDTNIFGIPKEPVGISNYNGKGIPGGFQKLKVQVNNAVDKITVNIGRI